MRNLNISRYNNYSVAKVIFDEVILWSIKKNQNKPLESLIGDIEKILDKVQEKGYDQCNNV